MKSRMMREYHVRFCERFRGEIPLYLLDHYNIRFNFQFYLLIQPYLIVINTIYFVHLFLETGLIICSIIAILHSFLSYGTNTGRKPKLLLVFVGLLLLRLATRQLLALLFQLPPRITRLVPLIIIRLLYNF